MPDGDVFLFARTQRVAIERELGKRSFKHFVRMAWHIVEGDPFIDNWHIDRICDRMQKAAMRKTRRLVVCIPPRCSKSLLVSVLFPAWVWTWHPGAKFITASYDLKLANRDSLKSRILIESPWYQERWPDTKLRPDNNTKGYYMTTAGGHRWTCSPTSGVTGEGADYAIFDDPHNVAQGESDADREAASRFWFEAMSSRFNDPQMGVRLVIQQRVHTRDVAGQCIERGYEHLVLPALYDPTHPHVSPEDPRTEPGEPLNPIRFPKEAVLQLAHDLREYAAAGQLQQLPRPREGGLFKMGWFQIVDSVPDDLTIVRRWDLASTEPTPSGDPDWTVGVKMGYSRSRKQYYVLDVIRLRDTPLEVEKAVKAAASRDGKSMRIGLPIDPGQAGKAQFDYYKRQLAGYPVVGERETGKKFARAEPLAAQAEAGNIFLLRAPWNDVFLEAVCSFPAGAHDDDVDAATGAFRMLGGGTTGILDYYAMLHAKQQEGQAGQDRATTIP